MIACIAWVAFAVAVALAGGTPGLLGFATVELAVIGSGAWAGRRAGSDVFDLFRPGERR